MPRAVREEHRNANQLQATVDWGAGGLDVIFEPSRYFPFTTSSSYVNSDFAPAWAYWSLDPNHPLAEVPPPTVQQQMAFYNQLKDTGDPVEQNALMNQILDIAAEEFFVIGINSESDTYGIVKNNFHNVPQVMPLSWAYPNPAPTNPCQYFIDPQE